MKNMLYLLIPVLLMSCKVNHTISQGIRGRVLWFEGNLMPGIDREPVEGKPVKRKIYFYAPTYMSQVREIEHVFYTDFETEPVRTVESDEAGEFSAELEAGTYSVLVEEPKGLFANRYGEDGLINPVRVMNNEVTEIILRIDYEAAY